MCLGGYTVGNWVWGWRKDTVEATYCTFMIDAHTRRERKQRKQTNTQAAQEHAHVVEELMTTLRAQELTNAQLGQQIKMLTSQTSELQV